MNCQYKRLYRSIFKNQCDILCEPKTARHMVMAGGSNRERFGHEFRAQFSSCQPVWRLNNASFFNAGNTKSWKKFWREIAAF